MTNYLRDQIITYMGNKRKFVGIVGDIIDTLTDKVGHQLTIAEGFSGSGILSRLFKEKATALYVNDTAGYSNTLSHCFLATPSPAFKRKIVDYLAKANAFADTPEDVKEQKWVQLHWAPTPGHITKATRGYFTTDNAKRIDRYRSFIETLPGKYKPFLLAPLLVECSIHNNTNGQFSAFYRDEKGLPCFGGKKGIDLSRITGEIRLRPPVLSDAPCQVKISRLPANQWVKHIPEVDLTYYDPPYNKHPYSIYYFMLDIINNWNTSLVIPPTLRGQPRNWVKSAYNSSVRAKAAFTELIANTKSRFILVSYNNEGIIPLSEIEKILSSRGTVERISVDHRTYNKLRGIAAYKRKKTPTRVKEFLWLVRCR